MKHHLRFCPAFTVPRANQKIRKTTTVDRDGNLVLRVSAPKGCYRFFFEVGRGTFDPAVMFLKVNGVRVGPTARFWRVPGFEHVSPQTRFLPSRQMVCPIVEVYLDYAWIGSAITDFPSQKELKAGYHVGEFALELSAGAHLIKLVNGRGYRLKFLRITMRPDERVPLRHVAVRSALRGRHPRLFFTRQALGQLRAKARGLSRTRFEAFQRYSIRGRLEAFKRGTAPDSLDVLPFAFMFQLSGQQRYFEIAQAAMIGLLARELPGPDDGRLEVNGAEPGHLVEIAACYYDWCYHALPASQRELIRATVARVMRWWMRFIKFNTLEWPGNPGGMEHSAYNFHGVGLAGLAFAGEIPEAGEWLDWAARHFELASRRMTPDGALGLFPKEHCFQAFFNYAMAFRHVTGINILARWPFFRRFPDGRIRREMGTMEMFPTVYRSDYEPDFIAWEMLAALTRAPEAQWLAERYFAKARCKYGEVMTSERLVNCSRQNALWRFLHHDPSVPAAVDFSKKPLDRLLAGTSLALLRSAWFDSSAVAVMLNGARAHGRKLYAEEHRVSYALPPQANMIGVYGFGELLIGPAAGSYRSSTADGSTLTIEGDGQMEEGSVFGVRKTFEQTGRITVFRSGQRLGYAVGEASQCYEVEVGVRRFTRHVFFFKPDVIIVADEVELDRPRAAAIHFVFPILEASGYERARKLGKLTMISKTQAHFAGKHAGLLLAVPAALKLNLRRSACRLARNYTDKDSEYERLTVESARSRRHLFLTLLVPVAGRALELAPRIVEASDAQAIRWQVLWRRRAVSVTAPCCEGIIRAGAITFRSNVPA